jgi:hypothetical protein
VSWFYLEAEVNKVKIQMEKMLAKPIERCSLSMLHLLRDEVD